MACQRLSAPPEPPPPTPTPVERQEVEAGRQGPTGRLLDPAAIQESLSQLLEAQGQGDAAAAIAKETSPAARERCSETARALLREVNKDGQLKLNDSSPRPYRVKVTGLVDAYLAACLTPVTSVSASFQDQLKLRIGILSQRNYPLPIKCGVARLTRDLAVTARHCIFDPCDRERSEAVPLLDLGVRFLSDPGKQYRIKHIRHPKRFAVNRGLCNSGELANDWAVLQLEGIGPDEPDLPAPRSPTVGDRLVLAAFQPVLLGVMLHGIGDRRVDIAAVLNGAWAEATQADIGPLCRAAVLALGGCLSHACQSFEGMSGSPVFQVLPGGGLQLIGLHTRANEKASACSGAAEETGLNGGLVFSAELLGRAQ